MRLRLAVSYVFLGKSASVNARAGIIAFSHHLKEKKVE
jgi:hypothetical protein